MGFSQYHFLHIQISLPVGEHLATLLSACIERDVVGEYIVLDFALPHLLKELQFPLWHITLSVCAVQSL